MKAAQQCREQIAPRFSDWDFALRGLNDPVCSALLGAAAFADRVKAIPHRASERSVAETQLNWWRAQLSAQDTSDFDRLNTSRHPSLTALGDYLTHEAVLSRLQRLLDLAQEDMDFAGFASRDDMLRFFRTRGAVTLELFAAICHAKIEAETCAALGYVMEFCDLIAHFHLHSQAGIVYFAQTDLQEHGHTAESLIKRDDQQAGWLTLFNEQTALAQRLFTRHIGCLPKSTLALKRYLLLRWHWLQTMQQHGFPLYRYHLQLGHLHKYFICLKARWN